MQGVWMASVAPEPRGSKASEAGLRPFESDQTTDTQNAVPQSPSTTFSRLPDSASRPGRLAAKDVALSRQWHGFESRSGYGAFLRSSGARCLVQVSASSLPTLMNREVSKVQD